MKNNNINCPHCHGLIEFSEDFQICCVECPSCNKSFDIEAALSQSQLNENTSKNIDITNSSLDKFAPKTLKACPFCGELILEIAIKCKHCGSSLLSKSEGDLSSKELIGIIACFIPFCSTLLIFFWLRNMPILNNPLSKLNFISVITVIITSILITVEVVMLGIGSDTRHDASKWEGPVTWFLGSMLMWLIAFPAWMARRANYGKKNLFPLAVFVSLIFTGVSGYMHYSFSSSRHNLLSEIGINVTQKRMSNKDVRNHTEAQVQIGQLATAVQRFYMDTGRMPSNLEALRSNPGVNNWKGPYATRINKDPWGEDYIFTSSGSSFEIRSNAGGTEGGPISSNDL